MGKKPRTCLSNGSLPPLIPGKSSSTLGPILNSVPNFLTNTQNKFLKDDCYLSKCLLSSSSAYAILNILNWFFSLGKRYINSFWKQAGYKIKQLVDLCLGLTYTYTIQLPVHCIGKLNFVFICLSYENRYIIMEKAWEIARILFHYYFFDQRNNTLF